MAPSMDCWLSVALGILVLVADSRVGAFSILPNKSIHQPSKLHLYNDHDDDDEEDDEPPDINVADFRPPTSSFGWNKGHSSPSTRKAMGTSGTSKASIHICSHCGSEFVKWMGRCPTCKSWNSLQEHAVVRQPASVSRPVFGSGRQGGSWLNQDGSLTSDDPLMMMGNIPVRITDLTNGNNNSTDAFNRQRSTRLEIPNDFELNTVLGGGLTKGSLILLGGDPGVGKSTLLLQAAGSVASLASPTVGIGMGQPASNSNVGPVWYVSGEETPEQIASRASRLGIESSELFLLRETHVDTLCEQVVSQSFAKTNNEREEESAGIPSLPVSMLVVDSIQTMVCDAGGTSAPGGVTQVRECVGILLRLAKSTGIPVFLIGHVTKSGDVAGPRTVEHMVDCVLYLEGISSSLRMLRASKNRFGSSDEVGVYEMTAGQLLPVSDPSSLFLAHRNDQEDLEGCAIAISLEGMRPITVEVQALCTMASGENNYGGRRTVNGIAYSRLQLLLGVLQKRCRVFFAKQDVYVNVVGNINLEKGEGNAADLAIAVALASSLYSIPVRSDTAFVGEVGLLGELRSIPSMEKRLQEAVRMGFSRVVTPPDYGPKKKRGPKTPSDLTVTRYKTIEWIQCKSLKSAINAGLVSPIPKIQPISKKKRTMNNLPETVDDLGLQPILDDEEDDQEDAFL